MSRRERISDFTRTTPRNTKHTSGRGSRRITGFDPKAIETPEIKGTKKASLRTTKQDFIRSPVSSNPSTPKQDKSRVLQRKGLNRLPPFKPIKPKRRFNIRLIGAGMAVLALTAVTPYLFYKNLSGTQGIVMGVKNKLITGSDLPKYFISSSIMDVPARVDVVDSIDDDSQALQDNNKIGWYQHSSKPGEPGAMVFAGHVSGDDNTGALKEISKMKAGDSIRVDTGDGRVILFNIVEVKKILPSELNVEGLKKSRIEGKEGVNIVSFTDRNSINPELVSYRYIIYAVKE